MNSVDKTSEKKINLTHLMSRAPVPKKYPHGGAKLTHESTGFNWTHIVSQFDSSMWVLLGTRARLIK